MHLQPKAHSYPWRMRLLTFRLLCCSFQGAWLPHHTGVTPSSLKARLPDCRYRLRRIDLGKISLSLGTKLKSLCLSHTLRGVTGLHKSGIWVASLLLQGKPLLLVHFWDVCMSLPLGDGQPDDSLSLGRRLRWREVVRRIVTCLNPSALAAHYDALV